MEEAKVGMEMENKQNELVWLLEDLQKNVDVSSSDYNNIDKALKEIAISTKEYKEVLDELKAVVESDELREKLDEIEEKIVVAKMKEKSDSIDGMKQEVAELKKDVSSKDVAVMNRAEQLRLARIGREINAQEIEQDVKALANKWVPVVSWLAGMANK